VTPALATSNESILIGESLPRDPLTVTIQHVHGRPRRRHQHLDILGVDPIDRTRGRGRGRERPPPFGRPAAAT